VINTSHLIWWETELFYLVIYRQSTNYCLPTSHFTFKELNAAQTKSHRAFLRKMRFNSFSGNAVMYGPEELGGRDLIHLYDEQGFGQIKLLVKFWRTPDNKPGVLLRITMKWAQYTVGISISILSETSLKLPHLEAVWLASMREYLHSVQGSIELDEDCVEAMQRENDAFIMDIVLEKKFKPAQTRRVNYCRMYLNVLLISDIATANGTAIDPKMYKGEAPVVGGQKHQVKQERPNETSWKQWCRLLNMIAYGKSDLTLRVPLGRWQHTWNKLRRKWPFLYDTINDNLFKHTTLGYTQHEKITVDYDSIPNQDIIDPVIPATAVPVDVVDRGIPTTAVTSCHVQIQLDLASRVLQACMTATSSLE
jgi:hypothetical protein